MNQIEINKTPSFSEIWYEGKVIQEDGKEYKFWLIHPQGKDEDDAEYACEIRWFFVRIPKEVRVMYPYIIESFLQTLKSGK